MNSAVVSLWRKIDKMQQRTVGYLTWIYINSAFQLIEDFHCIEAECSFTMLGFDSRDWDKTGSRGLERSGWSIRCFDAKPFKALWTSNSILKSVPWQTASQCNWTDLVYYFGTCENQSRRVLNKLPFPDWKQESNNFNLKRRHFDDKRIGVIVCFLLFFP